jgi:acyl-CoA hydrolase
MTVVVEAVAEALLSGERRVAVRGSFEMVAVDDDGRPTPVPPLMPIPEEIRT